MTYSEITKQLPSKLAHSLQLKLEDRAISTHLTEEEVLEIVEEVVQQVRLEAGAELSPSVDAILTEVPDAVVEVIFC